jgi:ATP-dependent Clp protease ATP-binding subunit ClpB
MVLNLCRLVAISPSLINLRHPLGWAPLHAAVLSGDPSLVKFVLDLPGTDIMIRDSSTFNATSPTADILCRQKELCPNICGTESTSGATALHFACLRGDWDILQLLLEAGAAHDVKDDSKRLPQEYFDLERVNLETYEAYHTALNVRRVRWRSVMKKGKDRPFVSYAIFTLITCIICRHNGTLRCHTRRRPRLLQGVRSHLFGEFANFISFLRILDVKPELAHFEHPHGWTALHVAVMNQKHTIVDLILSRSIAALNSHDSWDGSYKQRGSFASNRFPHREVRGFTALHYACLVGDMEIMGTLLRRGAKWTISDDNNVLPEHYINVSNGDDKKHEFKRLCEEETSKQLKLREQEDKLRRAKEAEEQSKQSTKLAEEAQASKKREQEAELRRTKEFEEEEESKRLKVEEELLKRRTRQSKCFSPRHQLRLHFFF